MFSKYFLKVIRLISVSTIFLSTFISVSAQTTQAPDMALPDFKDVGGLINSFNQNISQNLVITLSGLAFVVFLFGLVRFIMHRSTGKDADLKKDKEGMLWGLAALFVLVSVWGIIRLVQDTTGTGGDNNIHIPKICFTDDCSNQTSSNASNQAGIITDSSGKVVGGLSCKDGFVLDSTKTTCVPDLSKLDTINATTITGKYSIESVKAWKLPLKSGSTGDAVAQLQTFLTDQHFDAADPFGRFALRTETSLKLFQFNMKLEQTGIVNEATRAVIIYRVLKATPDRNTQTTSWPAELEKGNTGDGVKSAQSILNKYGCYQNGSDNDADGNFGNATEAAVKNYQAHNNLLQDGIIGPSTRAVMSSKLTNDC